MKVKIILPLLLAALILGFSSCKKEATHSDLILTVNHMVGGEDLVSDEVRYVNPAGNEFSVERLIYYISNIELSDDAGNTYTWDDYQLIDLEDPSTQTILLKGVPVGNYTSMTANIGLDATRNAEGLPNTAEHNNMIWPTPMGGGYHFMKLEGRYITPNSDLTGYAMHLGRDGNLVTAVTVPFSLSLDEVTENARLNFDIMEWHKNPANWDFNSDGTAIMANTESLAKLAANGATVLSLSE